MKKITFTFFLLFSLTSFSNKALNKPGNLRSTRQLSFTENKGQVSDQYFKPRADILFSGTAGQMNFYLKNTGISYQLERVDTWEKRNTSMNKYRPGNEELVPSQITVYRLDINWLNANSQAQVLRGEALAGFDNYYLTSCPNGALNVKSYTQLVYKNIYPGIDLKWYEKNGDLEYDYYVAANADYKTIRMEYKGAEKIYINGNGELIIKTPLGTIKEQKPVVIQNNKQLVAKWVVKNNIISFDVKNVDPSLPLVIDPLIRLWGTFYGGNGAEDCWYTNVDVSGNVFISGSTKSTANISTSGAHQNVYAGLANFTDGYVVKFNSSGIRQWATYYGGSGSDYAAESTTDASGNVFLTGGTTSTNTSVIATPGSHQPATYTLSNMGDAFLVMFNASGVRQWGTYYGGNAQDVGYGLSQDNAGNIYMVGASQSTNAIATPGSHQPSLASGLDCFLVKFNSSGVRQWGTYYGGPGINELAWDCVTNASGDTYISGVTTSSAGISTPGSHQVVYAGGGLGDGFFAKFNSSGVLQWGTYYGGSGDDDAVNISLDASGNLYGSGHSNSASVTVIASAGSYQSSSAGGNDAYLVKFDPAGVRLWATYYGGSGNEVGNTACTDVMGNVYLAGETTTNTGTKVATPCAYQSSYGGGASDAFLAKFTSAGVRLWGTYYGTSTTDHGCDCRADAIGNIYLCGFTFGTSTTAISSSNGHQPVSGGSSDGFLVKFDGCIPSSAPNLTPNSNMNVCSGKSATLSTTCGNWYNMATGTLVLGTGSTFSTGPILSDTTFYVEEASCGSISGTRTAVNITLTPAPTLTLTNSNSPGCVGESATLTAMGANTYSWVNPASTASTVQVYLLLTTTYSVTGTGASGCEDTASIAVNPQLCLGIKEPLNINPGVKIYPNPSNGAFTIQSEQETKLILTDELGQVLKTIDLSEVNNYQLVLKDLSNGIYFLTGEDKTCTMNQKIVVLH